ncbi:MAG: exo-alpha-sialidase [Cyclobacteriaceae bacterium]|nr:exo-alpha-sialidase [Cyclobacteriaceae bacterium]
MMKMRLVLAVVLVNFSVAHGQFKNLTIGLQSEKDKPPVNPALAISRKDSKIMVVAVAEDKIIHSRDGGLSWKTTSLKLQGTPNNQPVLTTDAKGEFYYYQSTATSGNEGYDRIWVGRSSDGGETWSEGEPLGNPSSNVAFAGSTAHPRKQIYYTVWSQFDKVGLADANCLSNILFSQSSSNGKKWSKTLQVSQTPGNCVAHVNATTGAMPAVDALGRVFVTWHNQHTIFLDRSFDGGTTWLTNDLAIARPEGGVVIKVPGLSHPVGNPILKVDNSKGRLNGSLYLTWADQRNGAEDTDIWFIRSTNRGDFWTQPLRVNQDDVGKHQFMPQLAIDDETGYIYLVYYDRRAYADLQTDVYLAYSVDGGASFKEVKISESPFVPSENRFAAYQLSIDAHKGVIVPVWMRQDEDKISLVTTIIKDTELIKK